jgi:hypothetical protein
MPRISDWIRTTEPRRTGNLRNGILLRDRDELVLLDRDAAVRLAHGDRVAGERAHHHALDHGLAADEHVDVAVRRRPRQAWSRGQTVRDGVERAGDQPAAPTQPCEWTLLRRGLLGVLRRSALEAVDAAGRVDQLLLAGEERMALGADLDAQLFLGRAGRPRSPQAQWTGACWYFGWISVFMNLTSMQSMPRCWKTASIT